MDGDSRQRQAPDALGAIRSVLFALDYEGKEHKVVDKPDMKIVGSRPDLLYGSRTG